MPFPHEADETPEIPQAILDQDVAAISDVANLGLEMERILDSEAFKTGYTLTRARIFTEWCQSGSSAQREDLHMEFRVLERLVESLRDINEQGFIARDAIRRRREAEQA